MSQSSIEIEVDRLLYHRAWQSLGLSQRVQFDYGREFCGYGPGVRWLSRLIRFGLRLGIAEITCRFCADLKHLPLAICRITVIRQVTAEGDIDLLKSAYISANGSSFKYVIEVPAFMAEIVYQTWDACNFLLEIVEEKCADHTGPAGLPVRAAGAALRVVRARSVSNSDSWCDSFKVSILCPPSAIQIPISWVR
jgi:hypothetical protein